MIYFAFFILLILFLILKNTVMALLAQICGAFFNMCCASRMKAKNQVPCIYKEYPILDLQQIYKKA